VYTGGYKIPHMAYTGQALYTNTGGRCAYRGPWMMETVARELMVDVVAEQMGIDPLEIRRRNVLQQSDFPYTNAAGLVYETISPAETLEQAAEMIGYDEFRALQAKAREEGRYLGLDIHREPQFGFGILGSEGATIRVEPSGKISAFVSSGSHGQGNETTAIQLIAEELGVDMDDINFTQGDTASTPYGAGTGGSRSAAIISGAAIVTAQKLRDRIVEIGSRLLEASPDDVEFVDGSVAVKGDPTTALTLAQVAAAAYLNTDALPPGTEAGIEVSSRYKSPAIMFSNACHAVTVETDPATGVVQILRYVISEDCGNMINPMVVEGQVAGGVAQGIGGVFYEHFEYDADGNPLTTTFLDYHLPTAAEIPDFEYGHVVTPSNTPGGYKGMGEGGAICAPAALINAVKDSLRPFNVKLTTQPLTPEVIVNAIAAGAPDTSIS
jgi:carbon-monoxide dehydrogenase large subunit